MSACTAVLSILLICLPIYCTAYSFASAPVENVDGGIQLNFTLNDTVPDGTSYIVFVECVAIGINETAGNESDSMQSFTLSCAAIEANLTELQGCCDDCITNGSSQGSLFMEGPVRAGEEYVCSLFSSFNGAMDFFDTENITALTGYMILYYMA